MQVEEHKCQYFKFDTDVDELLAQNHACKNVVCNSGHAKKFIIWGMRQLILR